METTTTKKPLSEMTDEHFEQLKQSEAEMWQLFQETDNWDIYNVWRNLRIKLEKVQKAREIANENDKCTRASN